MTLFNFFKRKKMPENKPVQNYNGDSAETKADNTGVYKWQESTQIPTKHFTKCFLWRNDNDLKCRWNHIGIDRRNGDIYRVALASPEKDFYEGNKISYEQLQSIISEIVQSTSQTEFAKQNAEKYRNLSRENWEEYAFYIPQNRYTIYETSYGAYGSGHYGNVHVTVELVVKSDSYVFPHNDETVPYGFFANKSIDEIEKYLSLLFAGIYGVGSVERKDIIDVAYRLKDSDDYLIQNRKSI